MSTYRVTTIGKLGGACCAPCAARDAGMGDLAASAQALANLNALTIVEPIVRPAGWGLYVPQALGAAAVAFAGIAVALVARSAGK